MVARKGLKPNEDRIKSLLAERGVTASYLWAHNRGENRVDPKTVKKTLKGDHTSERSLAKIAASLEVGTDEIIAPDQRLLNQALYEEESFDNREWFFPDSVVCRRFEFDYIARHARRPILSPENLLFVDDYPNDELGQAWTLFSREDWSLRNFLPFYWANTQIIARPLASNHLMDIIREHHSPRFWIPTDYGSICDEDYKRELLEDKKPLFRMIDGTNINSDCVEILRHLDGLLTNQIEKSKESSTSTGGTISDFLNTETSRLAYAEILEGLARSQNGYSLLGATVGTWVVRKVEPEGYIAAKWIRPIIVLAASQIDEAVIKYRSIAVDVTAISGDVEIDPPPF